LVYDVNVNRILRQLDYLETCANVLQAWDGSKELTAHFAVERALHLGVECMIDVGSVLIDGFVMRDPGGYLDIVDILADERVITGEVQQRLKEHVRLRERLIRYYDEVSPEEWMPFAGDADFYRTFAEQVKNYLKQELGEVFKG